LKTYIVPRNHSGSMRWHLGTANPLVLRTVFHLNCHGTFYQHCIISIKMRYASKIGGLLVWNEEMMVICRRSKHGTKGWSGIPKQRRIWGLPGAMAGWRDSSSGILAWIPSAALTMQRRAPLASFACQSRVRLFSPESSPVKCHLTYLRNEQPALSWHSWHQLREENTPRARDALDPFCTEVWEPKYRSRTWLLL
jgi:hypothetical protein